MIFRNRKKEAAILKDDVAYCRRCGSKESIWIGWDKDYEPESLVCTKCGWRCGKASLLDVIRLRREERKIRREAEKEYRQGNSRER